MGRMGGYYQMEGEQNKFRNLLETPSDEGGGVTSGYVGHEQAH